MSLTAMRPTLRAMAGKMANFNIMKISGFGKVWSVALQIALIDINDQ